jgi:hypothetical protein
MNRPISCLAAALVLGPVAMATAQDAPSTLRRYQGAQARFVWTTEPGAVKKGTLVRGDGTSLTFALPGEGEVTLPTSSVSRLDVYAGKKRRTWHGLVAGAAVGVALGFAAKVDSVDCKDSYTTACSRGEALATYGGAGALVGALVGTFIQSDRWTPVALPTLRTSSASAGRGSRMPLRFGVTFRF